MSSAPSPDAATGGRYPSLVDRTVLITGGATGIGESLVAHFAQQGARVGFIDIADAAAADLLGRLGGVRHTPVYAHCDLTDID
ncbi:MAG: SDR family NAD(P)-dependent oxidoreductase, partial [Janthinobacterium lividum]